MKNLIAIALLFVAGTASAASISTIEAKNELSSFKPNLNEGNIEIGGGFSFSNYQADGRSSSNHFQIAPKAEYFIMDQVSLGGTFAYANSTGDFGSTSTALGPSGTYYFHVADKLAFYGAQSLMFAKYSDDSKTYTSGTTSAGVKLFFAPQTAFGIGLDYRYGIGNDNKYTVLGMNGSFSIYY